jgi:hypothetical protein
MIPTRSGKERRSNKNRRELNDANYNGPERRIIPDRRSHNNRRNFEVLPFFDKINKKPRP